MHYQLILAPEDDPEKVRIVAIGDEREPAMPLRIGDPVLQKVIAAKSKFQSLVIPLSFFREGRNDYNECRYINAFFNFYFILEGWYGGGKTKNYLVEESFRKNADFVSVINTTLSKMKIKEPEKYKFVVTQAGDPPDIDKIIKWLVATRGKLSSLYKSKPKRSNPIISWKI